LIGTPEQIRERLAEYEEAGIQERIVRFVDAAQLEPVRLFARDCLQRR
jgi:alkanesulfonate monooxygenase SsuD/methylene tetrahydromethanopterin reductase-like flavin-dependent oxidoreductase (luciferase family)